MKGAYLGIVKIKEEILGGVDVQLVTKFADSEELLEKWMRLYPETEGIILNNNEFLERFFSDFEDAVHLTYEEYLNIQKIDNELTE